jgi:hypothetical protein
MTFKGWLKQTGNVFENRSQPEVEDFDKAIPTIKASIEFKMHTILRAGYRISAASVLRAYVANPSTSSSLCLEHTNLT